MTEFWTRIDLAEPVFLGAELSAIGSNLRSRLDGFKIFRRSEDLDEVECDACGDGHSGRITVLIAPPGSKPRAYMWCPEVGRVSVGAERLEVQRVELDRLATAASIVLGFSSTPCSLVDDRLWLLGTAQLGSQMRDVFFARGLGWKDGCTLADHARLRASSRPVILVPNRLPIDSVWTEGGRLVLSMSEFDWFGDGSQAVFTKMAGIAAGHDGHGVSSDDFLFRKAGKVWALSFGGEAVHLADARGLGYIAELLRSPSVAIEAADLAGAGVEAGTQTRSPGKPTGKGGRRRAAQSAGIPMADAMAIKAVREELKKKKVELSGLGKNDWARRGKLDEDISKLEKYLAEVTSLNGQARKVAGTAQRSRTAVTNAIDRALNQIAAQHPALGRHLKESIRTGTAPVYAPTEVPNWRF